jgi:hypothetical protein
MTISPDNHIGLYRLHIRYQNRDALGDVIDCQIHLIPIHQTQGLIE